MLLNQRVSAFPPALAVSQALFHNVLLLFSFFSSNSFLGVKSKGFGMRHDIGLLSRGKNSARASLRKGFGGFVFVFKIWFTLSFLAVLSFLV